MRKGKFAAIILFYLKLVFLFHLSIIFCTAFKRFETHFIDHLYSENISLSFGLVSVQIQKVYRRRYLEKYENNKHADKTRGNFI